MTSLKASEFPSNTSLSLITGERQTKKMMVSDLVALDITFDYNIAIYLDISSPSKQRRVR